MKPTTGNINEGYTRLLVVMVLLLLRDKQAAENTIPGKASIPPNYATPELTFISTAAAADPCSLSLSAPAHEPVRHHIVSFPKGRQQCRIATIWVT